MKSIWQKYLLYASIVIVGGYILFETIRLKNTGFEGKSLWDWMELLIIPAVLAVGAFYLNHSERAVERQIAEDRAKLEREIATDRQQETALQAYIDRMSELLLKDKLRTTRNKEVRNVARTRTRSVLDGLDSMRKRFVLAFLFEAKLINTPEPVIYLVGANLKNVNLYMANLESSVLHGANLQYSNLNFASLQNADLSRVNLEYASLSLTNLIGADLTYAVLRNANLTYAFLRNTDLRGANLDNANLEPC